MFTTLDLRSVWVVVIFIIKRISKTSLTEVIIGNTQIKGGC